MPDNLKTLYADYQRDEEEFIKWIKTLDVLELKAVVLEREEIIMDSAAAYRLTGDRKYFHVIIREGHSLHLVFGEAAVKLLKENNAG